MTQNYFNFFPKIKYDLQKNDNSLEVTDITKRFRIKETVLNRPELFYEYVVKEEERADVLAEKIYGNSSLDWIILMANQVFDPAWDWPMGYYDFNEYLIGKYGSVEITQTTPHHYEKIVQEAEKLYDGTIIPERVIIVDSTAYHLIPDEDRRLVTVYEYEDNLNQRRRYIKILNESFIPQLLDEAAAIFRNVT